MKTNSIVLFIVLTMSVAGVGQKEVISLVYYHDIPCTECGESEYGGYYKQVVRYKQDTIFVFSSYYDEQFIINNPIRKEVYIRDGADLYRLNLKGEKKMFFTIKNDSCVFFERKSPDTPNESRDLLPGYQHRYRGIAKIVNNQKDTIETYKFFVSRVWYNYERPTPKKDDPEYYGNEYFYYYTKDFVLHKIEYLGKEKGAGEHWESENLGTIEDIFIKEEMPSVLF